MRITHIEASDFLGLKTASISLDRAVLVVCGANGAGKSSLRDGLQIALTGEPPTSTRAVKQKKDLDQLVRGGEKRAVITVHVQDGDRGGKTQIVLPSGKTKSEGYLMPPTLPFVLEAQRFAAMKVDDRRAFLFNLMRVEMTPAAIKARLLQRDCSIAKVDRIAPLLRAGFDAGAEEASSQAKQARGAWRQIAGEDYGTQKAEDWRAPVPKFDAKAAAEADLQLTHIDDAMGKWQREVGALEAQQRQRSELQTKLAGLQETAGLLARREKKLETDQGELARLDGEIQKAEAAAGGGPRVGLVHDMARALSSAMQWFGSLQDWSGVGDPDVEQYRSVLAAYEREHGALTAAASGDQEAAARLPALRTARATCASAVTHAQRDVDASRLAGTEAASLADELKEAFDAVALAAAKQQVEDLKAKRTGYEQTARAAAAARAAADAAAQRTQDAAAAHHDALQWDAIAEALSPAGIPADLLREALGPLNDRLTQSALDANWPAVRVDGDMTITCGTAARPYPLLSESERWRCDAMLAEAVSFLSGARLLLLDRFDVLEPLARDDLLAWLDVLASNAEIDTAIVFGTLKQAPDAAVLPPTVAAVWVEGGVVEHGVAVAEAA